MRKIVAVGIDMLIFINYACQDKNRVSLVVEILSLRVRELKVKEMLCLMKRKEDEVMN
jgi:hypothetical protein